MSSSVVPSNACRIIIRSTESTNPRFGSQGSVLHSRSSHSPLDSFDPAKASARVCVASCYEKSSRASDLSAIGMLGLGLREGKARDTTLESEQVANTFGWIQRVISASCGCSHDNATKRSAALDTTGTPGYSCDCQCSPVLSALRISAIGGMSKRRKILREGWPGRRRLEGNQAKKARKWHSPTSPRRLVSEGIEDCVS